VATDRDGQRQSTGELQLPWLLRFCAKPLWLLRKSAPLLLVLLAVCLVWPAEGQPTALERRGRSLAERMCVQCHAIGRSGSSPHVGAPPFHQLDRRLDLDGFVDRLRQGLMVGHPDMPAFRFSREDARAFVLYLRSIQAP
jgi:cytochrome c